MIDKKLKMMRYRPYYRAKISHRCAVRTLESIQDILRPDTGTCSWGAYSYNEDSFDYSIYNMISQVQQLKYDSEKYHELKDVLNKVLK